jgi:hypothetical protein
MNTRPVRVERRRGLGPKVLLGVLLALVLLGLAAMPLLAQARTAPPVRKGRITGKVVCTCAVPRGNISVFVYAWNAHTRSWSQAAPRALTNTSGKYALDLVPGHYRVGFYDLRTTPEWAWKVWPDAATVEAGSDVVVSAARTRAAVDATLEAGGRLAGLVTDMNGNALRNIGVTLWRYDPRRSAWDAARRLSNTGPDGRYSVAVVPPGSWKVRFADTLSRSRTVAVWATEFYGPSWDASGAAEATLAARGVLESLDASLHVATYLAMRLPTAPVCFCAQVAPAARLSTAGAVMPDRTDVQLWAKVGAADWRREATPSYDATRGLYVGTRDLDYNTTFKFVFPGVGQYAPSQASGMVFVHAYLTMPKIVGSSPTAGQAFHVQGDLRPPDAGAVTVTAFRNSGGRYRQWGTYTAALRSNVESSSYDATFTLPAGNYYAYASEKDPLHVPTVSSATYFTVRPALAATQLYGWFTAARW